MPNTKNSNKGQVLVLVALSLVVFLGFAALAIDFAYFFHTKHQLQVAADAAALAGAANLDVNKPANQQDAARQEALDFAVKNTAAGAGVVIKNSGQDTEPFPPNNDVTVGFWNGNSYIPGGVPANAAHVRTRRTSDAPGGAVGTFFGKIFGKDTVNISADAIASRLPAGGTLNLSFCYKACAPFQTLTTFHPAKAMKLGTSESVPVVPDDQQMAWTNLLDQQNTNTDELRDLTCGGPKPRDVCDNKLYSTMANPTPLMRSLRSAFLNPDYDKGAKKMEFVELTGKTQRVWYAVIPVLDKCAATLQGAGTPDNDPKKVISYARVRIVGVCVKKEEELLADPCGYNLNPLNFQDELSICSIDTNPLDDPRKDYEDSLVIDRVSCVGCGDRFKFPGERALLVK